jgi:hypothetical protein
VIGRGRWLALAAAVAALGSAGCLQLETRVKILEDGGAIITERLRFSRALLDQAGAQEAELLKLLGREAALERMKSMGKGVTLVRHELRDAEGNSKESVAEFKVEDINGLRYASPWPAFLDYRENNLVEFKMIPLYKSQPYASGSAGSMQVQVNFLKPPKGEERPAKDAPPPKGPSPLDQQVYRELGPVARDMLKGFRLKLTLESYAPVHSGLGVRGESAGNPAIELLDFSDANLDTWGTPFLENQEIMLELVRWRLGGPNIVRNVHGYWANNTLPVFFPWGSMHMWWSGGTAIWFAPSKPLFDRHFTGKKLDYSQWQASPPDKHVPAEFDKIGWKGLVRKEKAPPKEAPAGEPDKK